MATLLTHSGVDATVADANGYLSNVYGLRMAPSPGKGRIISDSTTGRTVSSSSYQSSSFGTRPTVVRDYNQVIGIKKDENPFEVNTADGQ